MDEFVMAAVIWDEKDPSADHIGIHEDVKHFDNVCAALDWAKDHHMVRTGPTTILITMRD